MIQLTSGERELLVGIVSVSIVAVLINIVLLYNTKDLIGLIALLCLLLLLLIYNLNFVELFLDGDAIILRRFRKDIEYFKITRITALPISSRKGGSLRTIFLIKYLDQNQKSKFRFLEIPSKRILLFNDLKKRIDASLS